MSNQLRGLSALAEDPNCFLSTHINPKYLKVPLQGNPSPSCGLCGHCTHVHTHNLKLIIFPFL